jgi:universal stress protein A
MAAIKRVLVPLDLGDSTERTLDYAKMLAAPFGASLVLLHVVANPYVAAASDVYLPPPQDFLDTLEQDARNRLNALVTEPDRSRFKVETVVKVGNPLVEIVEHARASQVDLIVMGTHGRTGVAHFVLGSVAERVVRTAPCPVLTIR